MHKIFLRALALWLPILVAITGVFGCLFVTSQQAYRQAANDPQIMLAEEAASRLSAGEPFGEIIKYTPIINLESSISIWYALYANGEPVASTARLEGQLPRMPSGVFDPSTWVAHKHWSAATGAETRISWQPRPAVRQALVLVEYKASDGKNGFVAVGRSTRLNEDRIIELGERTAVAWGFTSLSALLVIFLLLIGGL